MEKSDRSLRSAAITAGIGILLMVFCAPFAELYVFPKLMAADPAITFKNLQVNRALFAQGLFAYWLTFALDIVVAWALYYFFVPVSERLSMLAAGLRFTYAVISLAALLNLVSVFSLLNGRSGLDAAASAQQAALAFHLFRAQWYFALLFFAIHLLMTGWLAIRAKYTPSILGILLIVSGLGYLLSTLRPYFYPGMRTDFAAYTFVGELIFMLWLLAMGGRSASKTSAA